MSTSYTILTEAGGDIGFGHLTRCSSLLTALMEGGFAAQMLVDARSIDVTGKGVSAANWKERSWLNAGIDTDVVIVDSYLADQTVFDQLKANVKRIVVIDDYNRMKYNADLLINPNVFFQDIDYSDQSAVCIGGRDYVILRKEFRELRGNHTINAKMKRIVVTLGGSDFRGLLPRLVSVLEQFHDKEVSIVLPGGHLETMHSHIEVLPLQTAAGMRDLFINSDLVICACGQTLHELSSAGRVAIGICLDRDQLPNQAYYLRSGFLLHDLHWDDADLEQRINSAIAELNSLDVRRTMLEASRTVLNRDGVLNVMEAIISNP